MNKRKNSNHDSFFRHSEGINISVVITVPILVLIAACGAVLILYSTVKYGLAVTHDSVAYMYAAESLLSGKGMQYFGYESPFVQWPPLFSLLLAGLRALDADLIYVTSYINAVIYAFIILISGLWVLKSTGRGSFAIMASLALLASIPLYYIFRYMWSESLFIFFTLLFFVSMGNHINRTNTKTPLHKANIRAGYIRKPSLKNLIMSSVFTALACLTRYMGITLIITGVLILLLFQKKKWFTRLAETILFGVISSLPTFAWIIRNYILTGTLTGGRVPSQKSLAENIELFFDTVALWIAPVYSQKLSYLILGILTLLSIIIFIISKSGMFLKYDLGDYTKIVDNANNIIILLIFTITYSIYIIFSATTVSIDSINNRLLSPIYPSLVLLVIFTMGNCLEFKLNGRNKFTRMLNIVLVLLLYSSWIIYPYGQVREEAYYSYENGAGLLASVWLRNSPTIKYINGLPKNSVLCSNSSDVVYIYSGKPSRYPPKKDGMDWYSIDEFKNLVKKNKNVYIIWFRKKSEDETLYSIDELREFFTIEIVDELYDSVIYKIVGQNL